MEELVAELSAAFYCCDLDLTPETGADWASYIGTWIETLRNDASAIFTAASYPKRAVDLLHQLQPRDAAAGLRGR